MTTRNAPAVTLKDIRRAAARIKGVAHRTPVMRSRTLDEAVGAEVHVKCENFQRIGAFKFRGAYNAASQLSQEQLRRGIAAYSSGNHAQAVALAARELGSTAVILMPEDTPRSKMEATAGYGAEIVTYDRYTGDRVALGEALAAERGLALIPPYEHPEVIAGQGTAALELIEEAGELGGLVVPVGGGGLIAGSATAAKGMHGDTRVIGVEPEHGDDTRRSLEAGGESVQNLGEPFGQLESASHFKIDKQGRFTLPQDRFPTYFCPDVEPEQAKVMAAVQGASDAARFGFVSGPSAWREHPTHFVVSENDQIIPPALEHFCAQRMGAKTTIAEGASHAVMVSQPQVVAQAILEAAR
jgi:cysteine synthase